MCDTIVCFLFRFRCAAIGSLRGPNKKFIMAIIVKLGTLAVADATPTAWAWFVARRLVPVK
jgi:hypothetical protein